MLNTFKNFIELALNKNQMGKPSPSEFNHAVAESLLKNYSALFSDFRKLNYKKSRFQDTANYGNEAENLKQSLEWYVTDGTLVDGKLPEDVNLVNALFSGDSEFDKVDLEMFNTLKRSRKNKPTKCNPIFTYNDGVLRIFPEMEDVEIVYFRKLKLPKWTYRLIGGVTTFDPDQPDYQDLDIHPIMYHQLFVDVLGLLGLNIKEEFTMQYVAQMKQEEQVNMQ